jgi:hypothetical protein
MGRSINSNLQNYWTFNNNVKDSITGASPTTGTGYTFVSDRLNTPNSAIYFNNGYLQASTATYFNGDFTVSGWVNGN